MQPWRFEEPRAVGRQDAHCQGLAVTRHLQLDFAAGWAARPDLAPETSEACHWVLAYREDAVPGPQPRLVSGSLLVETGNDDRILDLGGGQAQPRAHRTVRTPICQHVVEDRRQQVYRYD